MLKQLGSQAYINAVGSMSKQIFAQPFQNDIKQPYQHKHNDQHIKRGKRIVN